MIIKQANKTLSNSIAKAFINSFNTIGESWTLEQGIDYVEYMLKHQEDMLFVATEGTNVLGGIWGIIKPFEGRNKIVDIELFVDPEYQKNGISLQLYKNFLEYGIEKYNVVEIEGYVLDQSGFPLDYYLSLGRFKSGSILLTGDVNTVLSKVNKRILKYKK